MPEPIASPHLRRRRRRRRRVVKSLLLALIPFLLLALAGLLSLGIVDVVERSGPELDREAISSTVEPDKRVFLSRPPKSEHDLTLPRAEDGDLRRDVLPSSVVDPVDAAGEGSTRGLDGQASLGGTLPSVGAGPAVVPEPDTALLVVGGLAMMRALAFGRERR